MDQLELSIVRAHFSSKKDISFSSYLKPQNNLNNKTEEGDQISIFNAAKYFSGLHDDNQLQQSEQSTKEVNVSTIPSRFSSVSSSVETSSNYGGRNSHGNYRTRSFHATPTASSEASWNSQTGLLANPPGSAGITIVKSFSNNSNESRGTNSSSVKWPRISTKWLNKGSRCPCLGKKAVQVDERIDPKNLPRMVDLRQGAPNGSSNNLYSPRQINPKNVGTIVPSSTLLPNRPQDVTDPNYSHVAQNPIQKIGYSSLGMSSKVVGPLKLYDDLAKVGSSVSTNNIDASTTATVTTTTINNGFTFPILENPPIGVKKLFHVVPPSNDEPHRDSLEVFQPRSHPSPNKSRRTSYEDENVSDGSSDLFEIESFSTTTYPYKDSIDEVIVPSANFGNHMKKLGIVYQGYNNNQFKKSNGIGENVNDYIDEEEPMTPSIAPTDCYAPSEVSIDWSVTTAEGFDRGSLSNFPASASDFAYAAMRREAEHYKIDGGGGGGGECKGWHNDHNKGNGNIKSGGGLLLGCRNEKAISVGPSPIKCLAQEGPLGAARHLSGGPQGVRAAHINGRSRSNHLSASFTT